MSETTDLTAWSDALSFSLAERTCLHGVVEPASWKAAEEWLAHCITRRPGDLRRHVQRILLLRDVGNSELLAGALVDLFMVLGEKGLPLRQHLLDQCRARLDAERIEWFRQRLASGLPSNLPWPVDSGSVLATGATGVTRLASPVSERASSHDSSDVLEQVSDWIMQGNMGAALGALEARWVEVPADDSMRKELLKVLEHVAEEEREACLARLRQALLDPYKAVQMPVKLDRMGSAQA